MPGLRGRYLGSTCYHPAWYGDYTPPNPGGGSLDPQTDLSFFIPDANVRSDRQAKVSAFQVADPAINGENTWRGITADTSGWPVTVVTSAQELFDELNADDGTTNRVIECAWGGKSASADRIFGVGQSLLTADPAMDFGFVRPVGEILIVPSGAYRPEISGTYAGDEINTTGLSKIEFRDVTIVDTTIRLQTTSTYPVPTMLFFRNCTRVNMSLSAGSARFVGELDCTSISCPSGLSGAIHYLWSHNCTYLDHGSADIFAVRGYDDTYHSGWVARQWIANARIFNANTVYTGDGTHLDFFQTSTGADAHTGYSTLIEFCAVHVTKHPDDYAAQGVFGDDGGANGWWGEACFHNNLLVVGAYWGIVTFDPSDTREKYIYRNLLTRSANPRTGDNASQTITSFKHVSLPPASGGGLTFVGHNLSAVGPRGGDDEVSNFTDFMNTPIGASNPLGHPLSPDQLITGNGTWTTDVNGLTVYTAPDIGITDPVAAIIALEAFYRPLVGWADEGGVGPVNPLKWPTRAYEGLTETATVPGVFIPPWWDADGQIDGSSIDINFNTPPKNGGASLVYYKYRIDDGAWNLLSAGASGTTVSGLSSYQTYKLEVAAENLEGTSEVSPAEFVTVVPANAPVWTATDAAPQFDTASNIPAGTQRITVEARIQLNQGSTFGDLLSITGTRGKIELRNTDGRFFLRDNNNTPFAGNTTFSGFDAAEMQTYRFMFDAENKRAIVTVEGVELLNVALASGTLDEFPVGSRVLLLWDDMSADFEYVHFWYSGETDGSRPVSAPDISIMGTATEVTAHPLNVGGAAT